VLLLDQFQSVAVDQNQQQQPIPTQHQELTVLLFQHMKAWASVFGVQDKAVMVVQDLILAPDGVVSFVSFHFVVMVPAVQQALLAVIVIFV
jgi:hypothetical protein